MSEQGCDTLFPSNYFKSKLFVSCVSPLYLVSQLRRSIQWAKHGLYFFTLTLYLDLHAVHIFAFSIHFCLTLPEYLL